MKSGHILNCIRAEDGGLPVYAMGKPVAVIDGEPGKLNLETCDTRPITFAQLARALGEWGVGFHAPVYVNHRLVVSVGRETLDGAPLIDLGTKAI